MINSLFSAPLRLCVKKDPALLPNIGSIFRNSKNVRLFYAATFHALIYRLLRGKPA